MVVDLHIQALNLYKNAQYGIGIPMLEDCGTSLGLGQNTRFLNL
jgi:hypothetical protein